MELINTCKPMKLPRLDLLNMSMILWFPLQLSDAIHVTLFKISPLPDSVK